MGYCFWANLRLPPAQLGFLPFDFSLGIVEAPFFPGAIYYLSCWYTKRELGMRMALSLFAACYSQTLAPVLYLPVFCLA